MTETDLRDRVGSSKESADLKGELSPDARVERSIDPAPDALGVLTGYERVGFMLAHRMNLGRVKRFWTFCQRYLGAGWIHLCTYNLLEVHGLDNLKAVDTSRPLLLVANHRSFFDMYVVSTVLFRYTGWRMQLFFPVRGRFFYESPLGSFVNFIMGWWSMYPPFFAESEKREFDKYSLRRLVQLCSSGAGNVIGFHPEGTRNRDSDPYSFLRPQPGIGKLVKEARPQVIPVFIAGLGNDLRRQVLGNWRGGETVRVHFGSLLDLSRFNEMRDHVRTYKEIADFLMSQIAILSEQDKAEFGKVTPSVSQKIS
jgi:1-acyl-sn-glycerol-3-phosphate acyltransferase